MKGDRHMQVRRIVNMLAVGTIVVGTTTACATKKFVRTEVEAVGTRGSRRFPSRSKPPSRKPGQNQARITQVDAKADQVGIWAKEAQTSAATANTALPPLRAHSEDRRRRSLEQAARLRSGHQRRSGSVQVRIGGAARGRSAAHRPDGRGPQGQPARQLRRDRRPHRFERRQDGEPAHRRSSAPKP